MRPAAKWALSAAVALAAALAGALAFAPYVYAELSPLVAPHVIVEPAPARLAAGAMIDDYWGGPAPGRPNLCDRRAALLPAELRLSDRWPASRAAVRRRIGNTR